MRNRIMIEHVDNGYIYENYTGVEVYRNLDEVLDRVLLHFEGLSEQFHDNSYGKITVTRGEVNHANT